MGRSSLHIQRKTNQKIQTTRNNMSVSFKVTLSKGEEQETRRFQVDKEVAGNLVYLQQKIAAIFPELRRSEPVLSWVDEDGDEVVVTSDEELQVALTALTGPVYKLKVKLGDKAKDGGHPGMARSARFIGALSAMAAMVQWLDLATNALSARTTTCVQPVRLEVSMHITR